MKATIQRFGVSANEGQMALIDKAAAYLGLSRSAYMRQTALAKAREVLTEDANSTNLS